MTPVWLVRIVTVVILLSMSKFSAVFITFIEMKILYIWSMHAKPHDGAFSYIAQLYPLKNHMLVMSPPERVWVRWLCYPENQAEEDAGAWWRSQGQFGGS